MKLKHLIIDTGAFVKQVNVWDLAEKLYTTQGVISEARDRTTKHFIARLDGTLIIREPSAQSCRMILEYSKKTGDYPSLSAVDLKLAALAYEIDIEEHGSDSHIKPPPEHNFTKQIVLYHGGNKTNNKKPEMDDDGFFVIPKKHKKSQSQECDDNRTAQSQNEGFVPLCRLLEKLELHLSENSFIHSETLTVEDNNFLTSLLGKYPDIRALTVYLQDSGKNRAFEAIVGVTANQTENEKDLSEVFSNRPHFLRWLSHILSFEDAEWDWTKGNFTTHNMLKQKYMKDDVTTIVEETSQEVEFSTEESSSGVESDASSEGEDDEESRTDDSDSDSDGWIGPSNVHKWKARLNLDGHTNDDIRTGCITVDFAIQNTLMHMGIHALGVDGRIIKDLKSFILRCHGCFKTTREMERVFCKYCGNKTLKKVAVSIEDGVERIHINVNKNIRDRRANIPIPRRRGGKHEFPDIVVDDQRLPRIQMSKRGRAVTDISTPGYSSEKPFVTRDVYSRSATLGLRVKKNKKK